MDISFALYTIAFIILLVVSINYFKKKFKKEDSNQHDIEKKSITEIIECPRCNSILPLKNFKISSDEVLICPICNNTWNINDKEEQNIFIMKTNINSQTLLIIPCCKTKNSGGVQLPNDYKDPLTDFISQEQFSMVLKSRTKLYSHIKNKEQFVFAINRYNGNLYKAIPNMADCIKEKTNSSNQPKLIILSALYGPLHPLSLINDYELRMPNTKNSIWHNNFPSFLKNYVKQNNISTIRIYCGQSTGYYSVLSKSIKPLLKKKIIKAAIHYDIIDGNSYHTPHNHGLQLAKDLKCVNNVSFTKEIKENYL
jgi:ssDNA-binding Zn-finger/Zn-ribbon topoisomerase 1